VGFKYTRWEKVGGEDIKTEGSHPNTRFPDKYNHSARSHFHATPLCVNALIINTPELKTSKKGKKILTKQCHQKEVAIFYLTGG
jgi:hypothetical protein